MDDVNPTTTTRLAAAARSADPDVVHGVHSACQADAIFLVTSCGLAVGWDERDARGTAPLCRRCHASIACPVCGANLGPLW